MASGGGRVGCRPPREYHIKTTIPAITTTKISQKYHGILENQLAQDVTTDEAAVVPAVTLPAAAANPDFIFDKILAPPSIAPLI